jgi:hypothetical protein
LRFELTDQTRQAIDEYLRLTSLKSGQFLFPGRRDASHGMITRHYAPLVGGWVASIGHRCVQVRRPLSHEGSADVSAVSTAEAPCIADTPCAAPDAINRTFVDVRLCITGSMSGRSEGDLNNVALASYVCHRPSADTDPIHHSSATATLLVVRSIRTSVPAGNVSPAMENGSASLEVTISPCSLNVLLFRGTPRTKIV